MEYLAELEQFVLLMKKKRGFGLPSFLYVKSVVSKKHAGDENVSDAETDIIAEPGIGAKSGDMSTFSVPDVEKSECRDRNKVFNEK